MVYEGDARPVTGIEFLHVSCRLPTVFPSFVDDSPTHARTLIDPVPTLLPQDRLVWTKTGFVQILSDEGFVETFQLKKRGNPAGCSAYSPCAGKLQDLHFLLKARCPLYLDSVTNIILILT